MPELSIFDLCVKITSGFEGTDYSTVTGNFDNTGLSLGLLQWNLGTGSLRDYILIHVNPLIHDFPVPITPLLRLSNSDSVVWAKDNILEINGELKSDWKEAFKTFLSKPSIINLQKRAIDKYFHRSKELCGLFQKNHQDKRFMAYSFDLAVQSWSLGIKVPDPNLTQAQNIISLYGPKNFELWSKEELTEDKQILVIASHLRALKCKPEWKGDFFARKCTIAMGIGIVHGKKYDFRKLFTDCS